MQRLVFDRQPLVVVSLRARPPAVASSKGGTRACSALMTVASCPLSCAAQAGLQGVAAVGAGVDWFDLSVYFFIGVYYRALHAVSLQTWQLARRRYRQSIHPCFNWAVW